MKHRLYAAAMIVAVLFVLLTACAGTKAQNTEISEDILTQTVIPQGKTPVTILVKNAFSIHTFEKAAEEKFPDIDIIQVGNYTRDMGIAEYSRRLEHHDLTDIVMTWPLDVGEEYWADALMDLSSLPVTGRYNVSMLDTISRDGKLYYLPGPAQVRGIVYNKTLFSENGWQVPTDFDGFVSLCQTIEKTGIRALQLGLGNEEVLDTAFVGYGYDSCFSKPADAQWIARYNQGQGSFSSHFEPALDTFQALIDAEILQKQDLKLHYQDRETMLFTRKCAMIEDSVLLARMGDARTGCTDEFALMPFFNPGESSDWARLYMVCYIGLNKNLEKPENEEKYEAVMRLLDYISTPEGQLALAGDTGTMVSSLTGMPPLTAPETAALLPALAQGRCAVFPTLKNAQGALRKGLAGMVSGDLTKEQVAKMVDEENANPSKKNAPHVLGTAARDFSVLETGNFVTDAMRARAGTDFALFLDVGKDGKNNSKGISARLYQGDLTAEDIDCILPDLKAGEAGVLQSITISGADLLETLEYSVLVDNQIGGWFYYFSGFTMEYAPAAEPGSRIRKIADLQGNPIDPQRLYTVAVMDGSVPEEAIQSVKDTGVKISDVIAEEMIQRKTITPSDDGRFVVCQP
ncbi:MAG: extracellular solute-binding protein [Ruthenibacterium sp.]